MVDWKRGAHCSDDRSAKTKGRQALRLEHRDERSRPRAGGAIGARSLIVAIGNLPEPPQRVGRNDTSPACPPIQKGDLNQ